MATVRCRYWCRNKDEIGLFRRLLRLSPLEDRERRNFRKNDSRKRSKCNEVADEGNMQDELATSSLGDTLQG